MFRRIQASIVLREPRASPMSPTLHARQPRPAARPAAITRPRLAQDPQAGTAKPTKTAKHHELRVAIVCDWLSGGGAELVVEQFHKMFPDAPVYASQATRYWRQRLDGKVKTGILQAWPLPLLKKFTPVLRVWWFSRLNLQDYDVVISSSGAEAKGIRVPPSTIHINYCHAPTHYYWSRYKEYMNRPPASHFS